MTALGARIRTRKVAAGRLFGSLVPIMILSGCATLGASGPTASGVKNANGRELSASGQIRVVDLDDATARRVIAAGRSALFSEALGDGHPFGAVIGKGDVLDIAIWEAPPAALYGSASGDPRITSSGSTARGTSLPEQMVDTAGQISVPFVGRVSAAGRRPADVEREIVTRLRGLAHDPQAIVRLARNATANVTVVGDVASSGRVPLSPKGERLLDVLAAVGGVKQPVGKTTIRISRGRAVAALPLEQVIGDPSQNIVMQADDVVTALFQPYSFTALGAIGNNAEIPFEGTGMTLSQALGRIGGLRDERANVRGVFIFRLEDASALDVPPGTELRTTPEGKVPVIYRVNLKDPASFFVAQGFPIRNKDVLYVSNAPIADIQKFVNIVSTLAFSVAGVANVLP